MARESRRPSTAERFKYGICLNDECSLCKSKEVQQVSMRKELVCSECGKELRECPPPKKKGKGLLYAVIGVVIVALAIACIFLLGGDKSDKPEHEIAIDTCAVEPVSEPKDTIAIKPEVDSVKEMRPDTVYVEKPVVVEKQVIVEKPAQQRPTVSAPAKTGGSLTLSYGKYSGDMKNGYPHGQGRLTYTSSRQINRNDSKKRMANSGDYVAGEFFNGFFINGKHYSSTGDLIETIMVGVGSEDSYESK